MMNISLLPVCTGINRLAHPLSKSAPHNLRSAKAALGYRPVMKCDARPYSNKIADGNETTPRKNIIRKIGKTGGQQNLVRLLSGLLSLKTIAFGNASVIFLAGTNIFEISQWPMVYSASLGLLVAGRFIQGVNTSIKPEFDNMASSELKQELTLKQACLKAQVRKELDKHCFDEEGQILWELQIGAGSHEFDSNDYGLMEYLSFKKLNLDFESSLGRQDVIDALANKPDGFYAKKRLLGELQ